MNTQLFHKYQNNKVHFALDAIAMLQRKGMLSNDDLQKIAEPYGYINYFDVVDVLCKANILERIPSKDETEHVKLAENYAPVAVPLIKVEEEYLAYILSLPHVDLFLNKKLQEKIRKSISSENQLKTIEHYSPLYPKPIPEIDQESFSNLLTAIQNLDWIEYEYRTAHNDEFAVGKEIPWKLEYDAYDQRWWVILYSIEQDRTIKARLGNLRLIKRIRRTADDMSTEQLKQRIQAAVDRLIVGKATLRVRNERNALERCAMVFERQALQQISWEKETNTFLFEFEYYKFDEKELTSRILYLGPAVQLLAPEKLKEELRHKIDRALALNWHRDTE